MGERLRVLGLFSREKAEGDLGNVYTYLMDGSRDCGARPFSVKGKR